MVGQFFQAWEIKVQFEMLHSGFIGSYFRLLGRAGSQGEDSYLSSILPNFSSAFMCHFAWKAKS